MKEPFEIQVVPSLVNYHIEEMDGMLRDMALRSGSSSRRQGAAAIGRLAQQEDRRHRELHDTVGWRWTHGKRMF
jgi:hypothetical protein